MGFLEKAKKVSPLVTYLTLAGAIVYLGIRGWYSFLINDTLKDVTHLYAEQTDFLKEKNKLLEREVIFYKQINFSQEERIASQKKLIDALGHTIRTREQIVDAYNHIEKSFNQKITETQSTLNLREDTLETYKQRVVDYKLFLDGVAIHLERLAETSCSTTTPARLHRLELVVREMSSPSF